MNLTKQKFLSIYAGQTNQTQAGIVYDSIYSAFMAIPCSCCESLPSTVSPLIMAGALATIRTEVGRPFLPVKEIISPAQAEANYGYLTRVGENIGNTQPGDGSKYIGRGLIQLTGRDNYATYGTKIGVDLINNPDLALDLNNSAKIFAHFFKDKHCDLYCLLQDFLSCRKKVNGVDLSTGLPNGWTTFQTVVGQYLN